VLGHSPVSKWIGKDQEQGRAQAGCCGASQWTTINSQYCQEALVAPLSLPLGTSKPLLASVADIVLDVLYPQSMVLGVHRGGWESSSLIIWSDNAILT